MIQKFEAQEFLLQGDVPFLSERQNKILKLRAEDEEDIEERLCITRSILEREENDILEQMDVSF